MPNAVPNVSAVVGAGTMGPGIALMIARSGSKVRLMDVDDGALERAKQVTQIAANALKGGGELSDDEAQQALAGIQFTTSLEEALSDVDFVCETVPEKLEIKLKVFEQMEPLVSEKTILSSNTSGIPISKLQEGRSRPERIVGMHWSNPPHIILVIEVIKGPHTSEAVVAATRAFTTAMKQVPVTEKEIAGFVENRILYALIREALHLAEEGVATPEDIDTTVRWGIGMKLAVIGPLALLDVAGMDIYHSVASYLNKELCSRTDISELVEKQVEAGNLGFKSGEGFYEYGDGQIPKLMGARVGMMLKMRQELMKAQEAIT